MELLTTVKGTALSKGKARTWLELPQSKLAGFGFARGNRIDVSFGSTGIDVTVNEKGARKVAGRVKPDGTVICILDLCCSLEQRAAMFNGSERVSVYVDNGKLEFRA